jgi:hypothetical protein
MVVQIWPGQTVTCLHTISPGHIWTTLYNPNICFFLSSQLPLQINLWHSLHMIYCVWSKHVCALWCLKVDCLRVSSTSFPKLLTHVTHFRTKLHAKFNIWRHVTVNISFWDAFANLRKATISFIVFLCLSSWSNSASNGRILLAFYIWTFFENQ